MRTRTAVSATIRALVLSGCAFATVRSAWMARADWLSNGTLADVDRAIQMEPHDGNLIAMAAVYRSENGDQSPAVDRELQRAARLNPLDSRIPMTLGLRAEFRGDTAEAEKYLLRAAEPDRQFKASWTLANFYVRRNRADKAWPLLRHCLELEPLGYNPDPVFDLLWDTETDPRRILALIPKSSPRLIQYLSYLIKTDKVAAAAEVWPDALAIADPASADALSLLQPLPGFLARSGHDAQALQLWNRLVDKAMLGADHLSPSAGLTLADPQFRHNLTGEPFGWVIGESPGVFVANVDSALRFELDGSEPEAFEILHTTAAVSPRHTYNVLWRTESQDLSAPADPGFNLTIAPMGGNAVRCPLLLSGTQAQPCTFATGESGTLARLTLSYSRAPGTTRPHGVFRLLKVNVAPAP